MKGSRLYRFPANTRRILVRTIAVVVGALLLGAVVAVAAIVNENHHRYQGINEGFALTGTYVKPMQDGSLLSFGEAPEQGSGIFWWAYDGSTSSHGSVKETNDPNCYLLEGEDAIEIGWVHLAYTRGMNEGFLFVRYGSDEFIKMVKLNSYISIRCESNRVGGVGGSLSHTTTHTVP